jgi:HEPN domain-containing protein
MFDRAYQLAERLITRLERVIELLEQLLEKDHV